MSWLLSGLLGWLEQAGIWLINQFIISIGALIASIVSVLPSMPTFPDLGLTGTVLTWFNYGGYYFPFPYLLTLIGIVVALWVAWMIAAIPLRWAKAVRGNQ